VPTPTCLVSTGTTGTAQSRAATWADSKVPLISPDRCTDTMASAPSATSPAYTSRKTSGAVREVLTGRNSFSATAIRAGEASSEVSSYAVAPMTTCRGTTVMPSRSASSGGRLAVESVTTTVVTDGS
jgi:hypothetical protein